MRGKNSTEFKTSYGIRQGAPSSALLFIVFINDLIDFVQTRCIPEAIIDTMHILLHADNTIVLSTNVSLFIKKCNVLIEYFDINKLKLNLGKSGFTIIGGNINDKHDILLSNGSLEYKEILKYLGVCNKGSIKEDVKTFVTNKRGNVITKRGNVITKRGNVITKRVMLLLNSLISVR